MVIERSPRRTKADAVYEALQGAIITGRLQPGEHLRQEDIAEQWGVSQTPVREAFRRLESDGLVEYEANRGVVVRGRPFTPPQSPLSTLARRWSDLVSDPDSIPGSDFP
jgi:DNA-binding GntR family transcriptional regulator